MAVSWNNDQLDAIKTTDKGVIVSAAAGSGKTAVLIERTIRLLTDTEHKMPADKLLAVTFTKDATAQMRDKLFDALEKKLREDPANEWIQTQMYNLNMATISTIDAFCFELVKNNLDKFEFQSGINIMESLEAEMIVDSAIKSAFEYYFEHNPEEMEMLIDTLTDNSQDNLEKIVREMFYFLRSLPFPDEWLSEKIAELRGDDGHKRFLDIVIDDYNQRLSNALTLSDLAISKLSVFKNVDDKNRNLLNSENEILEGLRDKLRSGNWSEIYDAFLSDNFTKLKITLKPEKDVPEEVSWLQNNAIENINEYRKEYKKTVSEIIKDLKKTGRSIKENLLKSADITKFLYKLCIKTDEIALEAKVEKNSAEFSDIEKMAVQLLVRNVDGNIIRTELAKEIVRNKNYQVILIDEFQDVNNRQELLFKAISDTEDLSVLGKNVFVVGDVKQSIYRFRQSNPLLFINAKNNAKNEDFTELKSIQLSKNYRSRKNVIDYVNYVFSILMSTTVGEIEYTDEEKLYLGAEFYLPEESDESDYDTEIMLVKTSEDTDDDDDTAVFNALPYDREHYAVAQRIKEMLSEKAQVEDKGNFRPCRPSDFCVLARNNTHCQKIAKALQAIGLKAYSEESSGYMRSREIAVMTNLLRIIDNPMKDIPLVSVMLSPVFGFTAEEVGTVRLLCKGEGNYDKRIYQVLNSFDDSGEFEDKLLVQKCVHAVKLIKKLRLYSSSMSLEHLIRKIYDETDFFAVASAFENSKQKRANLRLLLEYAAAYENNSTGGVAGFLRYLESAEKNDGKVKQAVTVTESSASVMVKTIHKSKGLEYPFVFLCGLSKTFNLSDNSKRVLFSEQLGVSMKIADHTDLSIVEPLNYKAQKMIGLGESLSEELRLLYVAMTRAKEKLFVVLNFGEKYYKNIATIASRISVSNGVDPVTVKENHTFASWIYMTLLCNDSDCRKYLLEQLGCSYELPDNETDFGMQFRVYDDLESYEIPQTNYIRHLPLAEKVMQLKEKYDFKYDSNELNAPAKLTVTEIVSNEKEKEYGEKNPEFYPQLPKLAEELTKLTASERGTYTHLFMELADYEKACESVDDELERLYTEGYFTQKEKDGVYKNALKKFFEGSFYQRMKKSSCILREKRFLVNFKDMKLADKYSDYAKGNGMLQGIADCLFKEEDGYVLVDYKTDNFKDITELQKYQTQLELYKSALDLILDAPVKSCYIYSLKLCQGVEISIK